MYRVAFLVLENQVGACYAVNYLYRWGIAGNKISPNCNFRLSINVNGGGAKLLAPGAKRVRVPMNVQLFKLGRLK